MARKPKELYVCKKHGKLTIFAQHIMCFNCNKLLCVRCGRELLIGNEAKDWLTWIKQIKLSSSVS